MVPTEERRDLAVADAGLAIRAGGDAGDRFVGLASPFNSRAAIGNPKTWGFYEEFMPGCYTDTLAADDQRLLIDHDSYYVVSRRSAGTLTATQTARGLECESALDDGLSYVGDLITNVRNGNITGMSIGFMVPPGGDRWSTIQVEEPMADGRVQVYEADLRQVLTCTLVEMSAVSFPAFTDTEASLRWAVLPALLTRGSRQAVERRAAYMPQLGQLLPLLDRDAAAPVPARQPIGERMAALRARYPRLAR